MSTVSNVITLSHVSYPPRSGAVIRSAQTQQQQSMQRTTISGNPDSGSYRVNGVLRHGTTINAAPTNSGLQRPAGSLPAPSAFYSRFNVYG